MPLGDLADVVSGGTPKRSEPAFFGGDIPWVKIGDMLQGTVAHTEESITDAGLNSSSAKLLPAGTLLLSIFATIGRTAILGVDAATNQAIAGLLIKNSSYVNANYLRRYLEFAAEGLANQGRGVAQANINLSILRSHLVPVPPIDEQRRIAAILDEADTLRAKRRLAISKIGSLTQAAFIDMFGDPGWDSRWPTACLGQICKAKGEYGANVPSRVFDGTRPRYLRITDIREDGTLIEDAVAPGGTEREWRSKSLHPGDICFARSGSVGKTFLMREEYAPLVFVNGADFKAAQMFTLAHELAHLFIAKSGVSTFQELQPDSDQIEQFCDMAAAEFLVPEEELRAYWSQAGTDNPHQATARRFKVSPVVAARRAFDLKLIQPDTLVKVYRQYKAKASRKETDGGHFWNTQKWRIGPRFATAIVRAVKEERMLYREAYNLTGLWGDTFEDIPEKLGVQI